MSRSFCFHTIFLYGFSFCMSDMTILFLTIDRLIAVCSPIKYRTIRSKHYILTAVVVSFIYSLPFVVLGFANTNDELVEPCNPPMGYEPRLMIVWIYSYITIAVAVVILNTISYFLIYRSGKKKELGEFSCGFR
ncbi:unnamed protein product [Gongylonema pulchrum]|uniref:G_PROTEIN_RECEP_F1_2 domain-containing protein n=1 Tax=Gongylonema pulchrum TaxID=637853 RepID=A0A183D0Y0_9BILA|nr:unnamed protein product [Gongylonema pulchrum]